MIDREEEERLTDQFIAQNLTAAARAAFRRLGIDRTDEIVDAAYDQHIESVLHEEGK